MKLIQFTLIVMSATISTAFTCTVLNEKCGLLATNAAPCCTYTFCDDDTGKCVPTTPK